jgi:hypothetical protein
VKEDEKQRGSRPLSLLPFKLLPFAFPLRQRFNAAANIFFTPTGRYLISLSGSGATSPAGLRAGDSRVASRRGMA